MGVLSRLRRPSTKDRPPRAVLFPDCPACSAPGTFRTSEGDGWGTSWQASSRGEYSVSAMGGRRVRQFFDCGQCGVRARFVRTMDSPRWDYYVTIN